MQTIAKYYAKDIFVTSCSNLLLSVIVNPLYKLCDIIDQKKTKHLPKIYQTSKNYFLQPNLEKYTKSYIQIIDSFPVALRVIKMTGTHPMRFSSELSDQNLIICHSG